MKILKLSKDRGIPGAYGGPVLLNHLLAGIQLKHPGGDEYVLSLRDEIFINALSTAGKAYAKEFRSLALGQAIGMLVPTHNNGGHMQLKISIESPEVADLISLYNHINTSLGIEFEKIPVPKPPVIENQSFIVGVRNDFRRLVEYCKSTLSRSSDYGHGNTDY